MNKLVCYIISLSLILPSASLAFNDEQVMAGISFNSEGSKFFIQYKEQDDEYARFKPYDIESDELSLELTSEDLKAFKSNADSMEYSGYRNVEGFKNNKRRDDWTFASIFVGFGLVVAAAGALTIAAIVSAIGD